MFEYGEDVILHRPGPPGFDSLGMPTDGERTDKVLHHVGVGLDEVQEPAGDGLYRMIQRCSLYFKHSPGETPVVIQSNDEFTVRGERYKVVSSGEGLSVWTSPFTGTVFGSTCTLRRVTA